MTRVLVTGATGFIGRNVLQPLTDAGFEVHAVARTSGTADVRWHQADLLDPLARRALVSTVRPTHLLHLAWCTEHGSFWADATNLEWAAASLDLVAAFRSAGGRRLVVAGSCAEYDWGTVRDEPLDESTSCRPATLYGQAKLSTQELVSAWARQTGLSQAWAVLFFLFGPFEHQGRVVPYVINTLLDERQVDLRSGSQICDFLPVWEAGRALAALLGSDVQGRVNIGSGTGTRLADMAGRVSRLLGRPDLGSGSQALHPVVASPPLIADIARLRKEVGFTPDDDLDSALASTISWWVSTRAARGA